MEPRLQGEGHRRFWAKMSEIVLNGWHGLMISRLAPAVSDFDVLPNFRSVTPASVSCARRSVEQGENWRRTSHFYRAAEAASFITKCYKRTTWYHRASRGRGRSGDQMHSIESLDRPVIEISEAQGAPEHRSMQVS